MQCANNTHTYFAITHILHYQVIITNPYSPNSCKQVMYYKAQHRTLISLICHQGRSHQSCVWSGWGTAAVSGRGRLSRDPSLDTPICSLILSLHRCISGWADTEETAGNTVLDCPTCLSVCVCVHWCTHMTWTWCWAIPAVHPGARRVWHTVGDGINSQN